MKADEINLQLVIEGCRNDNPHSQRKLYEHFYGYGMSICLRYAKNDKQAEEILNDGFLHVFRHLDQYDPDFPFKYWLRQILINAAVDYFRRHQRYYRMFRTEAALEKTPEEGYAPVIDNEDDVLPILQKLPPAYRLVFNLYVIDEYKHHEIAQLLGISVGTSKSNLARAKASLRRLLSKKQNKHTRHG